MGGVGEGSHRDEAMTLWERLDLQQAVWKGERDHAEGILSRAWGRPVVVWVSSSGLVTTQTPEGVIIHARDLTTFVRRALEASRV